MDSAVVTDPTTKKQKNGCQIRQVGLLLVCFWMPLVDPQFIVELISSFKEISIRLHFRFGSPSI
jgi:hypothetical protein